MININKKMYNSGWYSFLYFLKFYFIKDKKQSMDNIYNMYNMHNFHKKYTTTQVNKY